jgi:hypothetical protein
MVRIHPWSWLARSARSASRRRPTLLPGRWRPRLEGLEDRCLPATVTTLADNVAGSLRAAIANTPAGGTVDFQPGLSGTITLTIGNLPINKNLFINGPGAGIIAVSGGGNFQIFNIASGITVTISQLTITSGSSGNINGVPNSLGGAIFNAGTLSLLNSIVSNSIANVTFASNGFGGGIYNTGGMTLVNDLIANNTADPGSGSGGGFGGGIYSAGSFGVGGMTLINCTLTGNTAGLGGGIASDNGPLTLVNSTISGNSAPTGGTGGGVAIRFSGSTPSFTNTLVAGNTANVGPDVSGNVITANNNFIGDGTGSTGLSNGVNGNQVGNSGNPLNPMLGVLQNNGGPTPTLALLSGSRAIDAGTNNGAPTQDQRAFRRPVNNVTDIGAYEFQPPATVTTLVSSANPLLAGQPVTFTARVAGAAPNSNLPLGTVTFFFNGNPLGNPVVLSGGVASFTVRRFVVGTFAITATYSGFIQGDFRFGPSTSTPLSLSVIPPGPVFAVGGAPGRVQIRRVADGSLVTDFAPYGPSYADSVTVAVGDVNGDGAQDIVTGAFTGNPDVRVYDGSAIQSGSFNAADPNASLLAQFFPYALGFNVGANVAVGNISGNGFADIVTGATAGNPDVRVYNGRDIASGTFDPNGASLLAQWFPYGLNFNVGADVAVGDVNGDGFADVVTGATAGNPDVRVFNGRDIANHTFNPLGASQLAQWFAYGLNFNVGAFVAVGDTTNSGFGDVITGATIGNPDARVYSGLAIANGSFSSANPDASLRTQFFAFGTGLNIGVTVGAADFEGNHRFDILTGASAGAPNFRVVSGSATGTIPPAVNGIDEFATDITGGVFVGA